MTAASPAVVKLLYFAWVRERVGRSEEEVEIPGDVTSVADLVAWLATRGSGYAEAFANPRIVRAAIDRAHAKSDAAIGGAREIAFFPPVTGG